MFYQFKRTVVVELYSAPVEADTEKAAAKLIRKDFDLAFIHAEEVGRGVFEYSADEQERAGFGRELNDNYLYDHIIPFTSKDEYDEYFEETKYPISDDQYCKEIMRPLENANYEKYMRDPSEI